MNCTLAHASHYRRFFSGGGLPFGNAGTRGPTEFPCDVDVQKGDELGWFEHGSTVILFAPAHLKFADNVKEGGRILAGQALL